LGPFRIGAYRLPNNLILAPMAGVSDRPYRALCRRFGAGLAVSEMVSSDTSLRGSRKTVRRLDFAGETGLISVQIVGTDPGAMAEAARVNVGLGADIIDINMGCPAKKVCRVAAGSALLRDEGLVGRILGTVVAAVGVPVTLKIRTGWSPDHRNAVNIARIAEDAGIAAIAVHGRTRACGYGAPAEYETIREVRDAVHIPLIANGDIDSPAKARDVLDYTGADAIMLGRAAQGRPWIFREIAEYLARKHGRRETPGDEARIQAPPADWIRDVVLEHLEALYAFYGIHLGVRIARKHIAWYTRGMAGAGGFRARVYRVEDPRDQTKQVLAFFNQSPQREDEAA
jgi:tRNA-dihydrouridine synthase B